MQMKLAAALHDATPSQMIKNGFGPSIHFIFQHLSPAAVVHPLLEKHNLDLFLNCLFSQQPWKGLF